MAIFPQGLTNVDQRCNVGERRVLHQLKRCLGDDYLIWHDVPIGPRARQPDFVILSPRWGVLLLEVKAWKISTLSHATKDRVELKTARGMVAEENPLRKARDFALELVDLMKLDETLVHPDGLFKGKLLFPYGWGAVFSHIPAEEAATNEFREVFPPHQVLLLDDLEASVPEGAFCERLSGMFTVHYPYTLSLPQRDRVRWHLFPEVRIQQQGTLLEEPASRPMLPDLLQVMDIQQEQIARTLGEGHRVIHGAAGSGKTMILIFRAQQLAAAARPDQPILVLCFNRHLCDRITSLLKDRGADDRVQVRTFHSWCQDLVNTYQLHIPPTEDQEERYRMLVDTVERSIETGMVPGGQYTALLIDEAHDFEDGWLRLATRMVNPSTNSLLVLYDDAQSIYQKKRRRFSFASVGIQAQGRTSILRLNYRNTVEVLTLAVHCAQSLLQDTTPQEDGTGDDSMPTVQPATAGRRGPLPVLLRAGNAAEEARLLADRISSALADGSLPEQVAVLFRTKYLMAPLERELGRRQIPYQSMGSGALRRFDWKRPSVKLLTMHSAKGLEFPHVLVAGLQALPMKTESPDEAIRLLYVAMTRATHTLALSAHAESEVVKRVKVSLDHVVRSLSGEP